MKTNFRSIEPPSRNIAFGEQRMSAIATWTDDNVKISALEMDGRIVFFQEDPNGRIVSWIPKEILASFPIDGL